MTTVCRLRYLVAVAGLLLVPTAAVEAAEWLSLRTPHFLVIGDASAKEVTRVALRVEQFNEVISTVYPDLTRRRLTTPIVVVVFKDEKSFRPYQPRANGQPADFAAVGLSGADVSYLTLRSDGRQEDAERAQYMLAGLMVRRAAPDVPAWFVEGLAQYLSSFELVGDEARIGRVVRRYVDRLRVQPMLLGWLLEIQDDSVLGSGESRAQFMALSWLVTHYALMGKPERFAQLRHLADLVGRKQPLAQAFPQAFGFDIGVLEGELKAYLKRTALSYQKLRLNEIPTTNVPPPTRLDETDAQVWLGDLLAHQRDRGAEAAERLDGVLKRVPDHTFAHVSLGTLLMRQGKVDAALPHLQRAVAADVQNPYVHYYYSVAILQRAGTSAPPPDDRQRMVAALKRALELSPAFTAAERDLGLVYLLDDQPDHARTVLQGVLERDSDDRRAALLMARVEVRQGHLDEGRRILTSLTQVGSDAALSQTAKSLLAQLDQIEKLRALAAQLGQSPPPPLPPPPGRPVRVGADITQPAKTRHVPPVYPEIAQSARVQGIVIVEAVIGPDGKVRDARVLRSIPLLDSAAIDAVKQWEFEPTLLEGIPISIIMTVTVQFTLGDPPAPETAPVSGAPQP